MAFETNYMNFILLFVCAPFWRTLDWQWWSWNCNWLVVWYHLLIPRQYHYLFIWTKKVQNIVSLVTLKVHVHSEGTKGTWTLKTLWHPNNWSTWALGWHIVTQNLKVIGHLCTQALRYWGTLFSRLLFYWPY